MVKGINRRIVEIKETGSSYFEKAIFFVKADMPKGTSEYTLTQEASRIIDKLCSDIAFPEKPKKNYFNILKVVLSALAGGVCGVLLFKFI